jgi:predicted Fe-S protein YdhL (DUF1289 family)
VPDLPTDLEPVPSPCVGICCMDAEGVCIGCYRSISELSGWARAPVHEQLEILRRCRIRQEQAERDEPLSNQSVTG